MKTINEIVSDPDFRQFVSKRLKDYIKARHERPKPKDGFYYRRDGFDTLDAKGCISTDYFVKNITDIWLQKSDISSNERGMIAYICNMAAYDIVCRDMDKEKELKADQ